MKTNKLTAYIACISACLVLLSTACSSNDGGEITKKEKPQEKDESNIISNDYHDHNSFYKLEIERSRIYSPTLSGDWQYSHHPSIAYFNGKFISIFSNGILGEDEAEQRVLISSSQDFTNWDKPKVLVGTDREHVLTPGGLLIIDNTTLVAYYTQNDFSASGGRPNPKLYAIQSADGETWSTPIDQGIGIFPCHRPSRLSSGRLILTGNRTFYYTDNSSGVADWIQAKNSSFKPGDKASLVEGAIIEHKDSIYTLFRDAGKNMLWQESSLDGGEWGAPTKTKFTDNDTKSHLGVLPDGRYYYVGVPDTLSKGNRTPLILSLSDNGFKFDKHYIIADDHYTIMHNGGRWKAGQFGYPYSIIRNEHMYIVVTRRKETLEVIRFPLSQLDK